MNQTNATDASDNFDDVVTTLDLSEHETGEEAAKALYNYLTALQEQTGGNPEEIVLYDPEAAAERRNGHAAWTVSWEGGPFQWATSLTGGESLYREELGLSFGSTPEVTGFYETSAWCAEPYYSFDLQFFD